MPGTSAAGHSGTVAARSAPRRSDRGTRPRRAARAASSTVGRLSIVARAVPAASSVSVWRLSAPPACGASTAPPRPTRCSRTMPSLHGAVGEGERARRPRWRASSRSRIWLRSTTGRSPAAPPARYWTAMSTGTDGRADLRLGGQLHGGLHQRHAELLDAEAAGASSGGRRRALQRRRRSAPSLAPGGIGHACSAMPVVVPGQRQLVASRCCRGGG